MNQIAPEGFHLNLDPTIPYEKLGVNFDSLGGLIMVGVWLTRVSEREYIIHNSQDLVSALNNIYRTFSEWRHQIKQFCFNNQIDATTAVAGDGVPYQKGGVDYSDFESVGSQRLLNAIFNASSEKLRQLNSINQIKSKRIFMVEGNKLKYRGEEVQGNSSANYYLAFVAVCTLHPNGGDVTYSEIANFLKSKSVSLPPDKETLRKHIQNYITNNSNGFFHHTGILNQLPDGRKIIHAIKGGNLEFNNPIID